MSNKKYLSFDKKLRLTLTVVEATNIPKKDLFSESDPYCSVNLCHNSGDEIKVLRSVKTRTLKDEKNPVWKTRFAFTPEDYHRDFFLFSIHDVDPFVKEAEVCAKVEVPLSDLKLKYQQDRVVWVKLEPSERFRSGNNSLVPRLKIQICAENFGIDKDIDPIVEETRQDDTEEQFQRQVQQEERKKLEEDKKNEKEEIKETIDEPKPEKKEEPPKVEDVKEEIKPEKVEDVKDEQKMNETPIVEEPKEELKEETSNLVVAKFDYDGDEGAISMKVGDKFELVEEKDGWSSVVSKTTGISGWVPSDYIGKE